MLSAAYETTDVVALAVTIMGAGDAGESGEEDEQDDDGEGGVLFVMFAALTGENDCCCC